MTDRLAGKTIRWTFSDGPMKNKTFEHLFDEKGSVKFRSVGDDGSETFTEVKKYEVAAVNSEVYAASYLGPSGYTLTVVLDYATGKLVAFASNEKGVMLQHATFEVVKESTKAAT
jgi:hypothetical protein